MEALLTAIVLWLSINLPLPANLNHSSIKYVSAAKMAEITALTNKKQLQSTDVSASEISSDIVSLYNNASKTIYLRTEWTGKTPAELSNPCARNGPPSAKHWGIDICLRRGTRRTCV